LGTKELHPIGNQSVTQEGQGTPEGGQSGVHPYREFNVSDRVHVPFCVASVAAQELDASRNHQNVESKK